jgi:hypothetical protein
MFRKIRLRAAVATITALAAITVASAAPASAATNSAGLPAPTPVTAPNQAISLWENLTGTGAAFWWNVKFDANLAALKAS